MVPAGAWEATWRDLAMTPEAVFTDPRVKVWRTLPDRENATVETPLGRLHIKRYKRGSVPDARAELGGLELLRQAGIPTLELVAGETLADGRSFVVTADLVGYASGQQLMRRGVPFDRLFEPTARLAAQLHAAGLCHRDLYLCHFFCRETDPADVRLIDVARVRKLPAWPFARRWVVKDLAQFRYSSAEFAVPTGRLDEWLDEYSRLRQLTTRALLRPVQSKTRRIAVHDANLRRDHPDRNISLPE
jgi:hypothetical protein